MPTGPRAEKQRNPRSLSVRLRSMEVLLQAWHAIRRNGETSRSRKTREETKAFGAELPRKLRRIQERLRKPPYVFARQIGATPQKSKGKGKRPLVIAPIEDRIVQRAILDTLQDATELPAVQAVLATPTSIGGIRGRGVERATELIDKAYSEGRANFVAGSDISGFFTKIKQSDVVQFIREQTTENEFVELFSRALKVDLENANEMDPDDLRMFPTDDLGVAQGCPLSAFAGNVILRDFDAQFNAKGILCIRYIDDFMLLGMHKANVLKAFENAGKWLNSIGMSVYAPEDRPDKAFLGRMEEHHEFLGYKIHPGVYPPADKNRKQIIDSVREEIEIGKAHILRALNSDPGGKSLQLYAQTLVTIDKLLRAWSGSFGASRCLTSAKDADNTINTLLSNFIAFYRDNLRNRSQMERRRALGIHLISDDIRSRLTEAEKSIVSF